MQINRVIVIVLDSVGIGELPDANTYGDVGSHTMGNIAQAVGGLEIPNMEKMGLGNIAILDGIKPQLQPTAVYGKMAEVSAGKDTTTGHWELMGLFLEQPFPLYPDGFPPEVMDAFESAIGRGTLGNYPASGTVIIDELGTEHMKSSKPIVYTSGDSVFQIAAHEKIIPIEELYAMCRTAREILRGKHEVSRVIARPFIGTADNFTRTANRHDFSVVPPQPTVLDALKEAGLMSYAVGKINDIFVGQGITDYVYTQDNNDGVDKTIAVMKAQQEPGLIFVNLVDFDAKFGHRNNPQGYANALAEFDQRLPEITAALAPDDLLILTADHGNDPTFPGTDHTREYVPILITGSNVKPGVNLGVRHTFADLAATIAEIFELPTTTHGESFMSDILIDPDTTSIKDLQTIIDTNPTAIASLIDHTLLKATASQVDVSSICVEATKYGFASVCINPVHVKLTAELLKGTAVKTCTVIGFPLGANTTKDKVREAKRALKNGAQELDMVINIGALKAGYPNVVYEDIEAVVHTAHKRKAICKVIIETCYLTDKEKVTACELALRAGADFVKTSTGFGGGGATVEDVALMRKTVGDKAGVKASGGVRSLADAQAMVAAGANRIGASSGVQIVQEALGLADASTTEDSDY